MVELRDGRELGLVSFGDPDGTPCFSFHGIPGSRFEGGFFDEAARALGVRLVAVDRPGLGLSSPSPGRSVASFAADVAELADALDVDRFGVFGWSGGGPYALGCAAILGDRVRVTVVASSPAPPSEDLPTWRQLPAPRRYLWRLGTRRPWPLVPPMWAAGHVVRAVRPLARRSTSVPSAVAQGMHEAWRQGARHVAEDLHVLVTDWGFDLADISGRVHLWHGTDDTTIPVAMGRKLAEQIKGCEAHLVPGGHRVCVERAAEVLAPVVA